MVSVKCTDGDLLGSLPSGQVKRNFWMFIMAFPTASVINTAVVGWVRLGSRWLFYLAPFSQSAFPSAL